MLKTSSSNHETNYLYPLNNITTLKKIKIQNLTLISKKKIQVLEHLNQIVFRSNFGINF